jgi:uncharacterized membrane protein YgcG
MTMYGKIFKLSALIAFTILLTAVFNKPAFAQNTQAFKFESFSGNYYLDKNSENDSTMRVQETLVAVFPDYDQNHGILRAIPERYKNHTLSLKNISVTDESGKPYQFSSSNNNNNKVLKIGNPSSYVHGRVIYKINYEMQDITSYYPDHDELFWDINGDQWEQPFNTVTANIHIAKQLVNGLQDQRRCYAGIVDSVTQNCSITLVSPPNETYITASANSLQPRQTLSIVLAFKPGTFNQKSTAIKKEEQRVKIQLVFGIIAATIPPVWAFVFMFRRWRQFGNDPKGRGVIIPEYEPPKDFDVLNSDYLMNQKLRNVAITAAIIEAAVNGYLTIYEIPKSGLFGKKDYELELKSVPQNASEEKLGALSIIFGDQLQLTPGTKIKLSDIKKSISRRQSIATKMKGLEDVLATNLTRKGYFIKNPKTVKNGYIIWVVVMFFLCWFLGFLAVSLQLLPLGALVAGIGVAAVIVFLFSFIMPARSEAGVAAYDALLGLKDYIKLAEADRLKFLQSPEGAEKLPVAGQFDPKTPEAKVKLFEKLLPYAMLFNLEKDWAKQFNDIYTSPPSWYQGGNWSAFNAGYLVGSLNDFGTSTTQSFSSPSDSSGSGFSGGGAGGGGGGGGGGGW